MTHDKVYYRNTLKHFEKFNGAVESSKKRMNENKLRKAIYDSNVAMMQELKDELKRLAT